MGNFIFFYGVMGSGKSAALIEQIEINQDFMPELVNIVCLPYLEGIENKIESRNGSSIDVHYYLNSENVECGFKENVEKILENDGMIEIFIDEAQFLEQGVFVYLRELADRGVRVNCYGLMTDYLGNLFPANHALVALSDSIYKVGEVKCECGRSAILNFRNEIGTLIDLDKNKYVPRCYSCWVSGIINYVIEEKE